MDSREIKEKIKEGWLRANIIFEVIGKPAEHIVGALNKLVEVIGQEKEIKILSSKVNDAVETDNAFFSSFAEMDILLKDSKKAIEFVFDYMPASIEISEPNNFNFKLDEMNGLLNDLATKLHKYDGALKQANIEKQILFGHIQEIKKALESKGIKLIRQEVKKEETKEEQEDKTEKNTEKKEDKKKKTK